MTAQQTTDQRRALAASQALQARIRRENAEWDRRSAHMAALTLRQQIEAHKQAKKEAP